MTPNRAIDEQGNLNPAAATYLMLSMTKRCNMRCPGCYYLQQEDDFFKQQDIGLIEAKEIIKYYREKGVRQAIPNAEGDVLLHPEYTALVHYINQLNFMYRPWLVTNGIKLPDVAEFVVQNISEILISIDGSSYQKYTDYRGGNEALFKKVLSGVRSVVDASKRLNPRAAIIINCVMTADRCDDIPDMIRLAENIGADVIKFTNFHVAGETQAMKPVTAGDAETDSILRKVISRSDYRVQILLPSLYTDTPPPYQCRMLASIMIGSNGDFAPCCRMVPEAKWGNYFSTPEKHNNEALKKFRLSVLNASSQEQLPRICQKCAHLSPRRLIFHRHKKQWLTTNIS